MNKEVIREIEQLLYMLRQKVNVARNAKIIKQMGLYKYSIESAEGIIEELEIILTNK